MSSTKPHRKSLSLKPLSVQQRNAVDLLVTGVTDREVGEKVGVERETVTRWRLYNPTFQAELNGRRAEIWSGCVDRMRSLLTKALDATEEVLSDRDSRDRARIALELVKAAGLYSKNPCSFRGSGPEEAEMIVEEIAKKRESDNLFASLGAGPIMDSQREAVVRELESKLGEPLEETAVSKAKKEGA